MTKLKISKTDFMQAHNFIKAINKIDIMELDFSEFFDGEDVPDTIKKDFLCAGLLNTDMITSDFYSKQLNKLD